MKQVKLWLPEWHEVLAGKKRAKLNTTFFFSSKWIRSIFDSQKDTTFWREKNAQNWIHFFSRQNESGHILLAGPKLEGKKQDKIVIYGARKIWINIFFSCQSEAGHALLTLERHDVFAEKKQDKIVNYAWNATRHD